MTATSTSPLVGRDLERDRLHARLDAALVGHGGLVLVSGEAGIGKTTLVKQLMSEARDAGALVLTGGCYDLTTTPPYGPWIEAIQKYQPTGELPTVPAWFDDPEELGKIGSQAALFEATRRTFASIAGHQPLVIVLEDLHWSDPASLEALRYLARALDEAAILLLVTYREDELTRRHELYQLLPLLVRESQAQRIHLNPLDRDAVRALVTSRCALPELDTARLVAYVIERSEGNPFFASELLQGLEDEQVLQPAEDGWVLGNLDRAQIPLLLRQVLDARLARLSPDTWAALRVAAVIGQIVPLDLWQTVAGLDDRSLDQAMAEALGARVVEEAPDGAAVQFRHALLREALYESLILTRRRAWHREVGDTLVATPDPDPDAVAHHFQQAGDHRAVHWLIRAGLRAEGSYALRAAAGNYALAQAMLDSIPNTAQARGWVLLHIGHLLHYVDQERSLAYMEDAAQVGRQVDDPILTAYIRQFYGLMRGYQADIGLAVADMESAVASFDQVTSDQKERTRQAIDFLFGAVDFPDRRSNLGNLLFEVLGLPNSINTLIPNYVMWLEIAGRFHDAVRIGEPFARRMSAATDDSLLIQSTCREAYTGLAQAADTLGHPEEARHWRAQALEACEAIGHHALVGAIHQQELEHLLTYQTDQVPSRRRASVAAIAAAERAGGAMGRYPVRLHGLPLDLVEGRWEPAIELARMTLDDQLRPAQLARLQVFSTLRREQGGEELAGAVWADVRKTLSDGPATEPGQSDFAYSTAAQHLAADVALDAGDLEQARAWIEAHDRWLEWSGTILGRAEGALLWARYHQLAGDAEQARTQAERALAYASNPRQPLALIAAHRCLGQLASAEQRFDEAAEHLNTALELALRCEAPYEHALTLLGLADLASATSDAGNARRLLGDARAICEPLDAQRSLERIAALEQHLQQSTGDHPAGLSSREVEALELAATGLTNAEIGEALYISPRTVAQHLRSVYNKLGVNSRAAAVARWAELTSQRADGHD